MATDPKNNPGSRMRTILSSEETTDPADSPLSRLPRKPQAAPQSFDTAQAGPAPVEQTFPTEPRHVPAQPAEEVQPVIHARAKVSRAERTFRAFWTITGVMSLMVNGVLLAMVIYLLMSLSSIQANVQALGSNQDLRILSGLYTNFQKMERASIVTNIPVDAQIPIDLSVPIQRTTQITLASDTTIANARVRINTATLNIDAPAQVILPSGTVLEVAMNFTVPVQGSVPVHLDVPVNIPLANTELRDPFVGLQNVVKPFLCILEPNTLNLDGQPVCQ